MLLDRTTNSLHHGFYRNPVSSKRFDNIFKNIVTPQNVDIGYNVHLYIEFPQRPCQRGHSVFTVRMNKKYVWLPTSVNLWKVEKRAIEHTIGIRFADNHSVVEDSRQN